MVPSITSGKLKFVYYRLEICLLYLTNSCRMNEIVTR